MESIDNLICDKRIRAITTSSNALATSSQFASHRRAMVQASLSTVFGRKGRHLSGTFCLTGDTMEGIIQCLVFLKAFSVSWERGARAFNVFLLIFSSSQRALSAFALWWWKVMLIRWNFCCSLLNMKERTEKVMIKWKFIPDRSETTENAGYGGESSCVCKFVHTSLAKA